MVLPAQRCFSKVHLIGEGKFKFGRTRGVWVCDWVDGGDERSGKAGVRPIGGVGRERGGVEALGGACLGCDEMGMMGLVKENCCNNLYIRGLYLPMTKSRVSKYQNREMRSVLYPTVCRVLYVL